MLGPSRRVFSPSPGAMATYDCDDVPSDEVPGDDVPDECPVDLPQANLEEVASEQDVERLLNLYTLILRQMQPTGTDIIRGIPAFRVVQKGPRRWMKGELQKLYSFSEAVLTLLERLSPNLYSLRNYIATILFTYTPKLKRCVEHTIYRAFARLRSHLSSTNFGPTAGEPKCG